MNKDYPFHDRDVDQAYYQHQPRVGLNSREGIWKAVEQGLGIGFVVDFEFVPYPNLKAIRIRDAVTQTGYFLVYLTEREDSHLIRSFCDLAMGK